MKVGLLPLYIELYDQVVPEIRPRLEAFYNTIAAMLEKEGLTVLHAPFCRLAPEFRRAVESFELQNADAIVTLHMAYSPSLESIDVLCKTELPLVVLDTTETLEFGNMQDSGEIMFNHGIHGVMDMCSMLTRRGKAYAIAAGHYATSNVVARAAGFDPLLETDDISGIGSGIFYILSLRDALAERLHRLFLCRKLGDRAASAEEGRDVSVLPRTLHRFVHIASDVRIVGKIAVNIICRRAEAGIRIINDTRHNRFNFYIKFCKFF